MTRQDFCLIADAFREAFDENGTTPVRRSAIRFLAERMADKLATTNPRFDRERFLKACGVEA